MDYMTIALTGRLPVDIEESWPPEGEGEGERLETEPDWAIRVRLYADGRAIVYGRRQRFHLHSVIGE